MGAFAPPSGAAPSAVNCYCFFCVPVSFLCSWCVHKVGRKKRKDGRGKEEKKKGGNPKKKSPGCREHLGPFSVPSAQIHIQTHPRHPFPQSMEWSSREEQEGKRDSEREREKEWQWQVQLNPAVPENEQEAEDVGRKKEGSCPWDLHVTLCESHVGDWFFRFFFSYSSLLCWFSSFVLSFFLPFFPFTHPLSPFLPSSFFPPFFSPTTDDDSTLFSFTSLHSHSLFNSPLCIQLTPAFNPFAPVDKSSVLRTIQHRGNTSDAALVLVWGVCLSRLSGWVWKE